MAYRDGAGTGLFPAFRSQAFGAAAQYSVVPLTPLSGDRLPSTSVALNVAVSNTAGGNSDVQWQVATDSGFTSIAWNTTSTNVADGPLQVIASGLTSGTLYYWHARLAPTGTTTWGPWSATWLFTPDLNSGRALQSVELNTGFDPVVDPDVTAAAYTELNVGMLFVKEPDVTSVAYVDLNGGVIVLLPDEAVDYAHYGDVDTTTPTPHLWFLKPNGGRAGDGISVFCFGVGDLVGTYGGEVQINMGLLGWVNASVTHWQTFPETANAYTPAREIDVPAGIIDPQHTVVDIVVPSTALPPGYPLRIRTNGP